MKKLLIAVLAIAGLASCTNSDVEFEPQQKQIGLNAITQNRTRAMVDGTAFPAEDFKVWAWYKQVDPATSIAEWQGATTVDQQDYINNKVFTKKSTNTVWSGATPYYWPKLGSLLFAGYYPTSVANVTYKFDDDENVMTISGYTPGDYTTTGFVTTNETHTEDLMYFKMTPSSVNCATTDATDVDVTFQHALAWIKVTLAEAAGTPDGATITVSSVKFTGVNTTGTGTVADEDNDGDVEDIAWEVTSATADIEVLTSGVVLAPANAEGKGALVANQPIVIPQEMGGNLVITYTITAADNSEFTEVKTITLNTLKDNAATPNTIDKWEAGKCYTYAIVIGTEEILIDPIVTKWDDVTVPVEVE